METLKPSTRRTTGYKFNLIFILLAAGILTIGFFSYRRYERSYRLEVERQLSAIADLKVGELVQWRQERLEDGSVLFNNHAFASLVRRVINTPADADAQVQLVSWLGAYQTHSYDQVRLLDPNGAVILDIPAGLPPASSIVTQEAPSAIKSAKVTLLDFYLSENDQTVCLAILIPIFDDQNNNRPLGVLFLRNDPETYLYPYIQRWPTPSRTGETLLIRKEGNEAVFLNDLRFMKDAALKLRIPTDQKDVPAVKALLGQQGIVEGNDYRGEPVIAEIKPIPDSPWFIVSKMDESEMFAPVRQRLWIMIGTIFALLAATGLAMGFLYHQQTTDFYRKQYKTSEALSASEIRYRRLFEAAKDGILILDAETGMIVDVNPFLIEMLGYSHDQFMGKSVWDIGFLKDIIASHENFLELQEKQYVRYEDLPLETADGRAIDIEFVSNVYMVNHKKVIQCNIRDITERKLAQKKLTESEHHLSEAQNIAKIGSWMWNPATRKFTWSDGLYRLFQLDMTLPPPTLSELSTYYSKEAWGELEAATTDALEQGKSYQMEVEVIRSDGSRFWCLTTGTPVRDANGAIIALAGTDQDINDSKLAEEEILKLNAELEQRVLQRTAQLDASNKELEAFAYSVSHDLRAPLRAVDGFSRLILEEYASKLDAEGARLLGVVRTNAQQMDELITDLLDLSRTSRTDMHLNRIEMTALANTVFREAAALEDQAAITFIAEALPDAIGDFTLLKQVWRNLLGNAVKYSKPKPNRRIEVKGTIEGNEIIYSVRDNGVGFDPKYIHKLFGVFQRLHKTEEFEGTGIGLAIVQRIILRHNGRVWAEGTVGEGACFYFALPRRG